MPHTNWKIDRDIHMVLEQAASIEKNTVAEFLALVNRLREDVILTIVQGGEIDAYMASMIKTRLDEIMRTYEQRFRDMMSENQRAMFVKGIQVVDKAIETANILRAVPYLSTETLDQAQRYAATLVKNLTTDAVARISAEMDLAVLGQKSQSEVIREIGVNLSGASVFGTIRRRAEIIFRTEVNRINQMATVERLQQLAKQIPGLKKEWLHSHTGFPRAGHLALDGMIIPAHELFTLRGDKGEFKVFGPYDPNLPPGETVNCRCRLLPVIDQYRMRKAA